MSIAASTDTQTTLQAPDAKMGALCAYVAWHGMLAMTLAGQAESIANAAAAGMYTPGDAIDPASGDYLPDVIAHYGKQSEVLAAALNLLAVTIRNRDARAAEPEKQHG